MEHTQLQSGKRNSSQTNKVDDGDSVGMVSSFSDNLWRWFSLLAGYFSVFGGYFKGSGRRLGDCNSDESAPQNESKKGWHKNVKHLRHRSQCRQFRTNR